jgi:hypothetical protein
MKLHLPRFVVMMVLVFAVLALSVGTVSAQSGPYLQINNGDRVSVAKGENVQVVLQFGGRASALNNVGILCALDGSLDFTGRATTHGSFQGFSIAPAGFPIEGISFPQATAFVPALAPVLGVQPAPFASFIRGQNRNVAFTVKANGSGTVLCALVNGPAIATNGLTVDNVLANALGADSLTINVR